MAPHRLKNLIVREVSLVDKPAIKETFYVVKRMNEDMADDKITLEEVVKRHTEYQTGVSSRIAETKAFIEGALEREVDPETRGTLTKALEGLSKLAKMKAPGPMVMEGEPSEKKMMKPGMMSPDHDKEHEDMEEGEMKGKKKTKKSEETSKSLEGISMEIDFTKQNEALAQAVSKGLEVPLTSLTQALEGITKMIGDVSKEQEAIKKDLETKAGRDEIPNRKGVTKNATELPKEEDVAEKDGEGFEGVRKSDAYQKANPQERLLLFARHFAR